MADVSEEPRRADGRLEGGLVDVQVETVEGLNVEGDHFSVRASAVVVPQSWRGL